MGDIAAYLAIRAGEYRQYFEECLSVVPQGVYIYRVALVETPSLPDDHHEICKNLTVICSQQYPTVDEPEAWGWIQLEPETKELIGNDLLNGGARPGVWYYMTLSLWKIEPNTVAHRCLKLRKG